MLLKSLWIWGQEKEYVNVLNRFLKISYGGVSFN